MLAGVSTRRFAPTREPVGQEIVEAERSTSKSAVSREFVGRTREHLDVPLGLWDGSTENKTVTVHLLSDLVQRGLDWEQGVLVCLDVGHRGRPRWPRSSARCRSSVASATRSATGRPQAQRLVGDASVVPARGQRVVA